MVKTIRLLYTTAINLTEFSWDREAGEDQGNNHGSMAHAMPVPPGCSDRASMAGHEGTKVEER